MRAISTLCTCSKEPHVVVGGEDTHLKIFVLEIRES